MLESPISIKPIQSEIPSSDSSQSDDTNDESISNFFPATRKGFKQLAGKIKKVSRKDFEDQHRLRHLECFKNAMDAWRGFKTNISDYYTNNGTELWPVFSSVKNSNQNPSQLTYISYEQEEPLNTQDESPENDYNAKLNRFMYDLLESFAEHPHVSQLDLVKLIANIRKKYSISPSKPELLQVFDRVSSSPPFSEDDKYISIISNLRLMLRNKSVRSDSGVTVITVITSPGKFSCPADCYYCPNEPGQPRSYLSTEPAILRANQNDFDPILQFYDRAMTLYKNGHIIDKIEILILGGTWSGYPREYQESFVRDLFYAANIFPEKLEFARKPFDITKEQDINAGTTHRIIGVTMETRPDRINPFELYFLRNLGCTRVQIGIQHTNNEILQKVNRGHLIEDSMNAIYLLKENGFKVDIHLMPDLPFTTVEKDEVMFKDVLSDIRLQADQWKIYPCEITPFTEIEKWYENNVYKPYFEINPQLLMQLIQKVKIAVHPWIRLNRVIRDIPNPSIIAGTNVTNLRQILLNKLKKMGYACKCIRCRECKDSGFSHYPRIVIRHYPTQGGDEYFISNESSNLDKIFGFLRLRIRFNSSYNKKISYFKCLEDCALVRELHVYGSLVAHGKRAEISQHSQHRGLGQLLLLVAEIISLFRGYRKVAVIAGVGTREYYSKYGYKLIDTYMIKDLNLEDIKAKLLGYRSACIDVPNIIEIFKIDLNVASQIMSKDFSNKIVLPKDYTIHALNLDCLFRSLSYDFRGSDYHQMVYTKCEIRPIDFIKSIFNRFKWIIFDVKLLVINASRAISFKRYNKYIINMAKWYIDCMHCTYNYLYGIIKNIKIK